MSQRTKIAQDIFIGNSTHWQNNKCAIHYFFKDYIIVSFTLFPFVEGSASI